MKKFIFTLAVTMLATHLPAPTSIEPTNFLTISDLGNGNLQIVASGPTGEFFRAYLCVLESTTDFVNWTAISTNTFPYNGMVTNIVQTTNSMRFYRFEVR
jgi:hypothetical protein